MSSEVFVSSDESPIDQRNLAQSSTNDSKYGLNLLYDGADADRPDVDFVAVHGIGGHPLNSFTDGETGCCWLRDLLPRDSPRCRVFSYGYKALNDRFFWSSTWDAAWELKQALVEQATTRRRIFICHSTGGLLVKYALTVAHRYQQSVDVYKFTSGIVFLGTPHRDSSSADLTITLEKIKTLGYRHNIALFRQLSRT